MSGLDVRDWQPADDAEFAAMLRAQIDVDPAWPPAYAHTLDLSEWLGGPADLARWVATVDQRVVGHMGLGSISGAMAEAFSLATGLESRRFAELCRTVVDPRLRKSGIASVLTRKALKTALQLGRIPVSTVLTGRGTWLQMMLDTGWQRVGDVESNIPGERFVLLLAPKKFTGGVDFDGR